MMESRDISNVQFCLIAFTLDLSIGTKCLLVLAVAYLECTM